LQTIGEILTPVGRAAKTSNLRKASDTRFDRAALPVPFINVPKQSRFSRRRQRVGTGPNQTHMANDDINQLWKLIKAGASQDPPDWCYPIVIPGG
jgi:hypothetical protein